jgi:hypothetical protein
LKNYNRNAEASSYDSRWEKYHIGSQQRQQIEREPPQGVDLKSMKKPRSPLRVIAGYAILQLPSLALLVLILIFVKRWIDLPEWLVWCFVAIWAAKEVMMFPLCLAFIQPGIPRGNCFDHRSEGNC